MIRNGILKALTEKCDRKWYQKWQKPYDRDFKTHQFHGGIVMPGPKWMSYAQVSSQRYATHVHNTGTARQHVARDVHVAPSYTQRPFTWKHRTHINQIFITIVVCPYFSLKQSTAVHTNRSRLAFIGRKNMVCVICKTVAFM